MSDRTKKRSSARHVPVALAWWYGPMAAGGLAFGLIGDRRPFGEDVLTHPLTIFFVLVGAGLMTLRIVAARPAPELIADRALLFGYVLGLAMFLAGNFIATHWAVLISMFS
jgi:hypothetical protein